VHDNLLPETIIFYDLSFIIILYRGHGGLDNNDVERRIAKPSVVKV
jgi:hypothetical protein